MLTTIVHFKSLTFSWITLFRFWIHRDTHFGLSRLFSGFRLSGCTQFSFSFFYSIIPNFFPKLLLIFCGSSGCLFLPESSTQWIYLCKVFFNYIYINGVREILSIHSCEHHGSSGEDFLHNIWSFIIRSPFSPSNFIIRRQDPLHHEVTSLEIPRTHLLIKSFLHPLLV